MNGSFNKSFTSRFNINPGWLVVAVGFFLLLLLFGTRLSFGLYIKPMAESFGASRALVSGSQSLFMVIYSIFSLIAGGLSDKYGPKRILIGGCIFMGLGMALASQITSIWQYYLSYGLLVGMGSGAIYVPMTGAVSKFFTRRRNFAIGITASGAGLGQYLFPPFMEKVVQADGWQTAFSYTAILLLIFGISLPLFFLRGRGLPEDYSPKSTGNLGRQEKNKSPRVPDTVGEKDSQIHYSLRQAMATLPFWTYFLVYFIVCFVIDGTVFVHLYSYFTDIGFDGDTAAKSLGYIGLITTVTMIAFAPLGDNVNKRILLAVLLASHTGLLYWLINISDAFGLWLFILLYGLVLGVAWPLTVSIVADIFGSQSVSAILGACTLAFGIAGLIAPWMAGHIFDLYQSYIPIFYFIIFLSSLSVVFAYFTRKTKRML